MPVAAVSRRASGGRQAPQLVQLRDLTGGLDRRQSPSLIKPERCRRARNVRLSIPGEWQVRPGWEEWLTTSLGSGRPQGGARVYLEGVAPFSLVAHDGDVYSPSDAGVPGSADVTGLATDEEIFFPHDAELVAVMDATNVPQKSVDGTTWTQMGITPPAAPTAAAVAGGSLVKFHTYRFSAVYRSALTSSNESATVDQAVSGSDLTVRVTLVASADPQVTAIDVYAMDVTAGETVRRFAGTRANSNGTVDVTTNNWSAEEEAPTRRTVPPALAYAVAWKNRWWGVLGSDRTRIHFTEIFENQSWPALYFIDMPFTRGDEIAAIVPLGDVLVVFGKTPQAFLIIGQTSLDFEVRPSAAIEAGAFGPRAVAIVEQGILHAAPQGIYMFDGGSDRLLSYDFEADWRDMVETSTAANLSKIAACYHRRDKEVRIAVPTLPAYGSAGEWVLDLARTLIKDVPAWSTTDRAIGGYIQWDGAESTTGNHGRLFAWSNSTGMVYEESIGTTANGDDMVADYEGPEFTNDYRVARYLQFFVECEPNVGTFGVDILCDGRTVAAITLDIAGDLSYYGVAEYGEDVYGGTSLRTIPVELPLSAEGRTFQVISQYSGQAAFRWFGYGFTQMPEAALRGM